MLSDERKQQFMLFIQNVKTLMHQWLSLAPEGRKQEIHDAFKKKLKSIVNKAINWNNVYNKSIPDGLLMIIELEMKIIELKEILNKKNMIQLLNYEINIELYNFMNRIYNSYPNL